MFIPIIISCLSTDCPNGIDEQNCTVSDDDNPDIFSPLPQFPDSTQCNDWTFKCNNGQCIPYWWKCDGSKDCSDESDELDCNDDVTQPPSTENPNDPDYVPQCPKDKFLCPGIYIILKIIIGSRYLSQMKFFVLKNF